MKKLIGLFIILLLFLATGCNNTSQNNHSDGQLSDTSEISGTSKVLETSETSATSETSKTEETQMKYEIEIDYSTPKNGAGIIKVYKQKVPAMRFIGKNYGSGQHPNWGDAWSFDVFGKIEKAMGGEDKSHVLYEDAGAYCGLYYRNAETGGYDGWVGMFTPPDTEVPEGLSYIDFPEQSFGICWIYGKQSEVYNLVSQCPSKIKSAGMEIQSDGNGYIGFFERDQCPRFTTPDEKGNIIIDYCYFVK
ncbi:MAG: hypothetical protein A2Y17_11015 [Clostridiales bacterium GWF2_38_85]|nr:MAG: hypothetical protein A2Y17_11015 [Clostridiales bacterium GWF2_38_85]